MLYSYLDLVREPRYPHEVLGCKWISEKEISLLPEKLSSSNKGGPTGSPLGILHVGYVFHRKVHCLIIIIS